MKELLSRYSALAACESDLLAARELLLRCYTAGSKLLLCGNGGSCADCDHIVGELMKGFLKKRPLSAEQKAAMQARCPQLTEDTLSRLQAGLPAISLPAITALSTAFCNDADPALVYAQSLLALAAPGDVLLAISTSGNAANVRHAAQTARGLGLLVIALTGASGGALRELADVCIRVPETETFKVQELHLPVYHWLCAAVESHFFPV